MKTQKPNLQTQHDFRVAIAFLEGCKDRRPVNYDLKWQGVINLLAQPEEREEKDGPAFVPAEFGVRECTNPRFDRTIVPDWRRCSRTRSG